MKKRKQFRQQVGFLIDEKTLKNLYSPPEGFEKNAKKIEKSRIANKEIENFNIRFAGTNGLIQDGFL